MADEVQGDEKRKFAFLGRGFDTFALERRQRMVNLDDITVFGGKTQLECRVCTSEEQIYKSLEVKAEVGVSKGGFDLNLRAEYAQSLSEQKNAVTVLVIASKRRRGELSVANFIQTPASGRALFQQGGDSYVSYAEEGSMYVASYQFQSRTTDEKMKISAELDVKFKDAFNAKVDFDMEKTRKSISTSYTFSERVFGGGGLAGSEDKVFEFARKFSETIPKEPILLDFRTTDYTSIRDYPADFDAIARYAKAFTKSRSFPDTKYSLATMESQAVITQLKIETALRMYKFYKISGDLVTDMQAHLDKLEKTKAAIRGFREAFRQDPVPDATTVFNNLKSQIDVSSLNMPVVKYELVEGAWTGRPQSGRPISTFDQDWVKSFIYPRAITVAGDQALCQLTMTYAQAELKVLIKEGVSADAYEWKVVSGTTAGGLASWPIIDKEANFGPGEVVQVQAWTTQHASGGEWLGNSVSGLYVERQRGTEVTKFLIKQDSSNFGGNAMPLKKEPTTSFMGFKLHLSPSRFTVQEGAGGVIPDRTIQPLAAIQPVYVRFLAPEWHQPQIDE